MIDESTAIDTVDSNTKRLHFHMPGAGEVAESSRARVMPDRSNNVLKAVYNVTRLINKERDRLRLLRGVCDSLVESQGYYHAWIALFDDSGQASAIVQSGIRDGDSLADQIRGGGPMACVDNATSESTLWITDNPVSSCGGCPMASTYDGRGALSVRLEHRNTLYGLLTASTPRAVAVNEEEQHLIEEIATDIGYALHAIEQEECRNRTEEVLQQRLKEMRCLYGIARVNEDHEGSPEPILQGIVDQLPAAWRYPEICHARIVVNDIQYTSAGFLESPRELSATIKAQGELLGLVQIYYEHTPPGCDNTIFQEPEHKLLHAVADHVGRLLHHLHTEQQLRVQHRALEDTNSALRTILGRIEEERREVGENITTNIGNVVMPVLQTLETEISVRQRKCTSRTYSVHEKTTLLWPACDLHLVASCRPLERLPRAEACRPTRLWESGMCRIPEPP